MSSGISLDLPDDEADALLAELSEVADIPLDAPEPPPATLPEGPRPFVFGAGAKAACNLPALTRVGERLARGLRGVIEPFARARTQVSATPLETRAYDEWRADQPYHIAVSHYRLPALQGGLLVVTEPDFITGLVESFYGGSSTTRPTKMGEFTASEDRLAARVAEGIVAALGEAWGGMAPFQPTLAARENTATHIGLVRDDDMVVLQSFTVLSGAARAAQITIVYPLAMLRPIEDAILSRSPHDASSTDEEWSRRMADAIEAVPVPVRSVLARPQISLGRLMALQVGDVIPLDVPHMAPLLAGDRLLALGTLGEQDGRAALMIQQMG